jgi:membrane-associated phospholipid phosphatase
MAAQTFQRQQLLKKSLGLFFLCAFFQWGACVESAHAQDWLSPDNDVSLAHLPAKFLDDVPHLFITENIAPFAVGTAATALDWVALDGENSLAGGLQRWNTQPLFDFGDFYGEGWVEGIGAVGSWSLGAITHDLRLQEFGRDASESLVMATILVTGLKYTVGRERPDGSNNQSFPSGHSITAFCFAPVVQKYWGWEAGTSAYLLGMVTMLARVEGNHHYLSDTIAGATLGIVIGNAVVYAPKNITVGVGPGQMELKLAFD